MKIVISLTVILLVACLCGNAVQAMTLTDDPATMIPLSMVVARLCKNNGMSYWEAFWLTTAFSVAKEVADQAARRDFNSGHIGMNLAGMTFSWFILDF